MIVFQYNIGTTLIYGDKRTKHSNKTPSDDKTVQKYVFLSSILHIAVIKRETGVSNQLDSNWFTSVLW